MKFATMAAAAVAMLLVGSWGFAQGDAHAHDDHAHDVEVISEGVCVLVPTEGSEVQGTILFKQMDGYVQVTGEVTGLTPGKHGFHIHEFGDLRDPKGLSTGGHFNPEGHKHGGPEDQERHAGDLGNITANQQGMAKVNVKANGLKLHYALGRGIVVHAGEDDLMSQPTGDAGGRVAVGVIGIAQKKAE